MAIQQQLQQIQVEQRYMQAAHTARSLKTAVLRGSYDNRQFENALAVLETLPLATDEFDLAQSRVRNAEDFSTKREYGAAGYELTLLANWLSTKANAKTATV